MTLASPPPLDIQALRRVAEAATQSAWKAETDEMARGHWSAYLRIPPASDLFLDLGMRCDARCGAEFTVNQDGRVYDQGPKSQAFRDVSHAALFDPPTALALLDRLEAAEALLAAKEAAESGVAQALIQEVDELLCEEYPERCTPRVGRALLALRAAARALSSGGAG